MSGMDNQPCSIPRVVGIVHKQSSPAAATCAAAVAEYLRERDLVVLQDEEEAGARADLLIVLGGDGTLIHSASLLRGRFAPILGVNMGSLGFLTEVPQAEMYNAIDLVLAGNARMTARMKLRVHLHRGGGTNPPEIDTEVLNDAVIAKGTMSRMAEFEATCSGYYVTTYKADGVIVATPTGSTAYALAANGPIVFPSMHAVIVCPICPHTLTQRPLVLPDDQTINIVLKSESEVYLTLDGQRGVQLARGDRVQIKQSTNRVMLIRNPNIDYFGILRAKLRWGER